MCSDSAFIAYPMAEVLKVTGLNAPLLKAWVRQGFVKPTMSGKGTGNPNQYSTEDIARIMIIVALNKAGFRMQKASEIAYSLNREVEVISD